MEEQRELPLASQKELPGELRPRPESAGELEPAGASAGLVGATNFQPGAAAADHATGLAHGIVRVISKPGLPKEHERPHPQHGMVPLVGPDRRLQLGQRRELLSGQRAG